MAAISRRARRLVVGLDAAVRDTRQAIRRLARDWRFTAAAVVILGLGIGANTAAFTVINAMLFRELPAVDPDRLVNIYQNSSNPGGIDANSYPAYLDMVAYTDVFADTTAALVPRGVRYRDEGAIGSAVAEHTTSTYLSVLGLRPALGRWFTVGEDRLAAPVVAVIGHQAWTRKFRADPSVIGRTIRIDGVPVTIVGVGPATHRSTLDVGVATDFWLPISSLPAFGAAHALDRRPDEAAFLVKARLRDGVTVAQAQAAMAILGARLATEYSKEDPGKGITVVAASEVRIHPQIDSLAKGVAVLLLAVVGLVLTIACSNLATLVLVRGTSRAKEVSIRLALGATRAQLVRHLLAESLLLSVGGGAAGCVLAWWAMQVLTAIELPVTVDVTLDYRVLAFAASISLVTGVAFGLAPALKATRFDLVSALRGDVEILSSHHRWLTMRNILIVVQVAVSAILLGATSIVLQMLSASQDVRGGFAVAGVAMLETDARYAGYSTTAQGDVYEEIRRRIAAIAGVQSVSLTRGLPMETLGTAVVVDGATVAAGNDPVAHTARAIWAAPSYFDVLQIPILFGRALQEQDRANTPRVAVVSEAMARRYFGADLAGVVGRRFRLERDRSTYPWIEVVGVARNTGTADLQGDLIDPAPELFYRSFSQWELSPTTIVARSTLDAVSLVAAMQRELRAVNVALPVISAKTMGQYLDESLAAPRAVATFLAALGGIGACLAGIGLYAVVAFSVWRRSREIGIRMALGARTLQIVMTVARDVAVLVGIGTGVGLVATLLGILAFRAVVIPTPGIAVYRPAADPVPMLSIAGLMALVALAAACVPARRAARMTPLTALRHD